MPAVASTTPPASRRVAFGARDSVMSRVAAMSAAIPIGRFTRKIHRHEPPVMSSRMINPPASGPVMVAIPITAPTKPKTRARSWGGKVTWITERTCGYIIAAIAPWSTRERSSMIALWASPHSADAITNPDIPMMNSLFLPKMSPSRPPVMSRTA